MTTAAETAMMRPTSIQDAMQGTSSEFSQELAPTAAAEAAKQEIQAAVVLAKRFPRNESDAYQKIIQSCKRPTFAADVEYSFPRGGTNVSGPSIYLAREFARLWGNIRHGCDIISDTDDERTIRAWAWDLESNTKITSDACFRKLIQRKRNGQTVWLAPDERDLRELTNKHAALAKRNCLLELLPSDMVEDACIESRRTQNDKAAADPDATRKAVINGFAELNVPVIGLEKYLGHPIGESSPDEMVKLRTIYKSIKDGNSTWAEYVSGNGQGNDDLAEKTKLKAAAMKAKIEAEKANEPDFVDPAIHDVPVEIDQVESFRADVQVQLETLTKSQQKDVIAGKSSIGDMTEQELHALSAAISEYGR